MAHDSSSEIHRRVPRSWQRVATGAPTLFGRYRRRRIDAVIDYFGDSRRARSGISRSRRSAG
jgi:hypothetical protein